MILSRLKEMIQLFFNRRKNLTCFIADNVSLGNSRLGYMCNVTHHVELQNSTIGKRTSIGRYTKMTDADIGAYCSISWDVSIGARSHPMERITGHAFTFQKQFGIVESDIPRMETERTKIGNDVWIGCNAVIMAGLTVGNGAVIGAGTIVTHDVDPYTIVCGVPGRVIRKRFSDVEIQALQELEWWNFPDPVLKENIGWFQKPLDIEIITKLKEIKDREKFDTV